MLNRCWFLAASGYLILKLFNSDQLWKNYFPVEKLHCSFVASAETPQDLCQKRMAGF